MVIQRTLISVLIAGLIVFAAQSVTNAGEAMIPNTQASGLSGKDRDAPLRQHLECTPLQIRENLAPSSRDNRAYLESARRDNDRNLPSGELKEPNILALVRIPLDRTVTHPLTPHLGSPVQNEDASQFLDRAGDPLHPGLTYPRPNSLC